MLGTDYTYTSNIIALRWNYIEKELNSCGVKVNSFGADGAGPFMKAMIDESLLFQKSKTNPHANLPDGWDFLVIPRLPELFCSGHSSHFSKIADKIDNSIKLDCHGSRKGMQIPPAVHY